jgi:Velvet factor
MKSISTATVGANLVGTVVSSLHRLKDAGSKEGAFFIFGDLYVKTEGKFRLQFNLYEIHDQWSSHLNYAQSEVFTVYGTKNFSGMAESTPLTKALSEQGVRLRIHKAPRAMLRKTGPASENYVPRKNKMADRNSQEDQSVKSEESRQRQVEQHGNMHQMQSSSFEQGLRMGRGRGFSQQTSESFSTGYTDEPNAKRPRTGSDQNSSRSFDKHDYSPEAPRYPGSRFTGTQSDAFDGFTQQQQPYSGYEDYTQSPVATTLGEHYDAKYSFVHQPINSM